MQLHSKCALLISLSILSGCDGFVGAFLPSIVEDPSANIDIDTSGVVTEVSPFDCSSPQDTSVSVLRRYSKYEYEKRLQGTLDRWLGSGEVDTGLVAASEISQIPRDSAKPYTTFSVTVAKNHVDGQWYTAQILAETMTESTANIETLFGSCATDADFDNDTLCAQQAITDLGEVAFGRPLQSEEINFYLDEAFDYDADLNATVAAEILASLLTAAPFIYRIEEGAAELDEGLFELSAFELANRYASTLWGSIPDHALLEAARAGDLDTEAGRTVQVDRMLEDPRTREHLSRFFRAWWHLDDLLAVDRLEGDPKYDVFLNGFDPSSTLHEDMLSEIDDLVDYVVFEKNAAFDLLFTDNHSFARSENLAELYGVETWNGDYDDLVDFAPGERGGLLTRAALLLSGYATTSPIARGVMVRRNLFCDPLPDPPADTTSDVELTEEMSQREYVAALTSPGTCNGCHAVINPIGFAFENYDAIGRYRSEERVLNDAGEVVRTLETDARTIPELYFGDEKTEVDGGVQLSEELSGNVKVHKCFAKNWQQYTNGREEDPKRDGCAMETVRSTLDEGGSIRDAIRAWLLHPSFTLRRSVDPQQSESTQ